MIPSSLLIILEAGQGETTLLPENASQVWKATGETTNGALEAARITQNEKLSFEETINWLQKGVTQ